MLLCHDNTDGDDICDEQFYFTPTGTKLGGDVQISGTVVVNQQNHTSSDMNFAVTLSQVLNKMESY